MALYFKTCPTTIADDRINDYLLLLQEKKNPSASYFKHTVYGLRLAFRLIDREDRAIRLPSIRRSKSLPVILNRKEVKALIGAPKWKKHRILIALIYSAGLRVREVSQNVSFIISGILVYRQQAGQRLQMARRTNGDGQYTSHLG